MPIVAGVMSIAHAENDPGLGEVIEASDVCAILACLEEGHSVHNSEEILARKAVGLAYVLARRDEGASLLDLFQAVMAGGPPWSA